MANRSGTRLRDVRRREPVARGTLVALEGLDCAGKSTLAPLVATLLRSLGYKVSVTGEFDSPLGEPLRRELERGTTGLVKVLAFAADRALVWHRVAEPALRQRQVVLWDRYVASAVAYRAAERRIGAQHSVNANYVKAVNAVFPKADFTVFVDIPVEESVARGIKARRREPDRQLLGQVKKEYARLRQGERPWIAVDGTKGKNEVAMRIAEQLHRVLQGRGNVRGR